jgi:hypothetical protein
MVKKLLIIAMVTYTIGYAMTIAFAGMGLWALLCGVPLFVNAIGLAEVSAAILSSQFTCYGITFSGLLRTLTRVVFGFLPMFFILLGISLNNSVYYYLSGFCLVIWMCQMSRVLLIAANKSVS